VTTTALVDRTSPHSILPNRRVGGTLRDVPEGDTVHGFGTARLAGMRVLVVDDDRDTVEALCLYLQHCGAEVLVLTAAAGALGEIEVFRPHALVSDMSMPDVDGCDMIRHLRAGEVGSYLPAVAFSAHFGATHRKLALRAGFDEYLTKPIDPALLVDAIVALTCWPPSPAAKDER
jgi:CheY-like chemotaxis protein